jgi:ankyrin repeat protein
VSYRFRWVFCQLETLRHCFPPNLRQFLNELPETLDETYERILRGINKAQKDDAHRLLQCLTVAVRPLQVEELAEILAFDFRATSERGIPKLKEDWRWDDQEEAVLSMCSSLVTIIRSGDSRVVQFSHFSVKEYLISPRLARSHGDVSRFHIDLDAVHTILVQACLGTLLQLDEHAGNSDAKGFPLAKYAAQHWVEHAQFKQVSSCVRDGMNDLFDTSKPHFAAWLQVHDIDKPWSRYSIWRQYRDSGGSPLYYAAFCGFYDLAEHLIMEHPEQVNARGGRNLAPLPAALYKRHFRVANLLRKHGAVVDIQNDGGWTPLFIASALGHVNTMQWLLNQGADANFWAGVTRRTPLHSAARGMHPEAVQVLLEHDADVNAQNILGETPLFEVLSHHGKLQEENAVIDTVRQLLEHEADTNIPDDNDTTPLHKALSYGLLEVVRLLLSYGAKVDEKDGQGRTPLQVALEEGYDEITKLLFEHGAVP